MAHLEVGSADWRATLREAFVRGLTVRDAGRLWLQRGGERASPCQLSRGLAEAREECRDRLVERIAEQAPGMVGVYEMALDLYRSSRDSGDLKTALAALREIRQLAEDRKRDVLRDVPFVLNFESAPEVVTPELPRIVEAELERRMPIPDDGLPGAA